MFGIGARDSEEKRMTVMESRVCLDWGSVFCLQIIHNGKVFYNNTDKIQMATMKNECINVSDFLNNVVVILGVRLKLSLLLNMHVTYNIVFASFERDSSQYE